MNREFRYTCFARGYWFNTCSSSAVPMRIAFAEDLSGSLTKIKGVILKFGRCCRPLEHDQFIIRSLLPSARLSRSLETPKNLFLCGLFRNARWDSCALNDLSSGTWSCTKFLRQLHGFVRRDTDAMTMLLSTSSQRLQHAAKSHTSRQFC